MSGQGTGPDETGQNTIRAILGVARGRADALGLFGDTPRAFQASLMPLVAVSLLSSLFMRGEFGFGRFLTGLVGSLAALLVPPVVTHALAVLWRREDAWLRFATAFNWCQFALLVIARVGLFLFADGGGGGPAVMILAAAGIYAIWLHWFLARNGLGITSGQAAALVLIVHIATSATVLVPTSIATILRSPGAVPS